MENETPTAEILGLDGTPLSQQDLDQKKQLEGVIEDNQSLINEIKRKNPIAFVFVGIAEDGQIIFSDHLKDPSNAAYFLGLGNKVLFT